MLLSDRWEEARVSRASSECAVSEGGVRRRETALDAAVARNEIVVAVQDGTAAAVLVLAERHRARALEWIAEPDVSQALVLVAGLGVPRVEDVGLVQ